MSGQEYRSAFFGHLNLYGMPALVFEGKSFHLDNDGPAFGVVGAKATSEGGYAIHAHGGYFKVKSVEFYGYNVDIIRKSDWCC